MKKMYKRFNASDTFDVSGDDPLQMIPATCDDFEHATSREKYIFDCPTNFIGCITQIEGELKFSLKIMKFFTLIKIYTLTFA